MPTGRWLHGQLPDVPRYATLGRVRNKENGFVPADDGIGDPFGSSYAVPVAGGTLTVAHAGPPLDQADIVVLAIHGITSNRMVWRSAARDVTRSKQMSVLAPDLRGRGESAALPGPYGIATHVADMLAVLDHVGVGRAVLVGHSMGAYVAARIAAEHPERTAGLVLVDGGTPVCDLSEEAATAAHGFLVGPALARRAMPFMSAQAYLDFWRQHPAFAHAWNDDVEAYVLHDLSGKPGAFRYVISVEAVQTDSHDMLSDRANRNAVNDVQTPLHLLRAERGALGDENPLIQQPEFDAFVAKHPTAYVEEVHGVNHYTLLIGDSPGPPRVAAAIEDAVRTATSA
jgi:pimeloyl-ACP methyl ester carboxylesterase